MSRAAPARACEVGASYRRAVMTRCSDLTVSRPLDSCRTTAGHRPKCRNAPVLFINPPSGGGKAARAEVTDRAGERGIDVVLMTSDRDPAALAREAVARGADALGAAGGDGSLSCATCRTIGHGSQPCASRSSPCGQGGPATRWSDRRHCAQPMRASCARWAWNSSEANYTQPVRRPRNRRTPHPSGRVRPDFGGEQPAAA
jgi:Diacylglycerol kinase catalytic domain